MDYERIKQIESAVIIFGFVYVLIGVYLGWNTYKIDKQIRKNMDDIKSGPKEKEQTRKPGVGPFVGMEDNTPFDNAR